MDMPNDQKEEIRQQLRQAALEYHEFPTPGKISVTPTKQLTNQRDLALAYTPGVAAACEEIVVDPANAFRYTARGNLVAVITNGTAVLGLGNIGPLASKPVMEGKAVLFKKFAGIDVFDIEINETDPDKLCDIIAALEPGSSRARSTPRRQRAPHGERPAARHRGAGALSRPECRAARWPGRRPLVR